MTHGRVAVNVDLRAVVTFLTLLRVMHNAAHPDSPIFQSDIASYIGVSSKSTITNYESGHSVPRLQILSKWLEFWGYKLAVVPIEDQEKE